LTHLGEATFPPGPLTWGSQRLTRRASPFRAPPDSKESLRQTPLLLLLVLLACVASRVPLAAAARHHDSREHVRHLEPGHKRAHGLHRHARRRHAHRRPTVRQLRLARIARLEARVDHERTSVVRFARRFLGVPYVYGGSTPTGFDCSGFTRYVFAHFGISLPHYTYAQFDLGRWVSRWALRPGDLVFFNGVGHVGLYIGHNHFIHAPHTGTSVSVASLSGSYGGSFVGARRVLD
jgi:cell wall-associated NlpC family hydrolase